MALRYAVDTNVLLRLSNRNHPDNNLIVKAMRQLAASGVEFCFTPQNIGELWNASTRPIDRNGFGLSVQETHAHVQSIERTMTLLSDDELAYRTWRRLLLSLDVRGVQVHDAHLAAVLDAHAVTHLLTFNVTDFKRFPNLIPIHPQSVEAQEVQP